jgi:hypothetical protein
MGETYLIDMSIAGMSLAGLMVLVNAWLYCVTRRRPRQRPIRENIENSAAMSAPLLEEVVLVDVASPVSVVLVPQTSEYHTIL